MCGGGGGGGVWGLGFVCVCVWGGYLGLGFVCVGCVAEFWCWIVCVWGGVAFG